MSYREEHRQLDILTAVAQIESHLERGGIEDGLIFDGVRMRIIEIGEAVKNVPSELLDRHPEVAWSEIARMRDHLAHRYFDTTHAIVQRTVQQDLVPLRLAATNLLAELQAGSD